VTSGDRGGDVGEGDSIRAVVVWASSVRTTVARSSSSRSVVAARTRIRVTSYFFFTSATMTTMASSFYWNSVASAGWRASSVAIGGDVVAHREAARITGDAAKGERAASS
jgi:hypothetical protein